MTKQLLKKTLILSVVAACSAFVATACDTTEENNCNHSVSIWETAVEATCSAPGIEAGVCGDCQAIVQRELEIDPENHPFNTTEWEITAPTETETGKGIKHCPGATCSEIYEVVLPVLSDLRYTQTVTARPTNLKDGESEYTMKDETGDITFTVVIPASGIVTVRDAVNVGTMEESKNLIRRAEGTFGYNYSLNEQRELPSIEYEFGENFTYSYDSNWQKQRYYETDENGKVYGFIKDYGVDNLSDDIASGNGNERYLDGAVFFFHNEAWLGRFYGIEHMISGLYAVARTNDNGDFKEEIFDTANGKMYRFSFGTYEGSAVDGKFGNMTVQFTLHPTEYTVLSLDIVSIVYTNNKVLGYQNWAVNDEGYAYILEGRKDVGERYIEEAHFTQTTKAEDPNEPINPYTKDKLFYQTFDIFYKTDAGSYSIINDNTKLEYAVGKYLEDAFSIENIQPSSATEFDIDSFSIFRRELDEHGRVIDIPISWDTINTSNFSCFFDKGDLKLSINSKDAGEVTIVVKSTYAEKTFTISFIEVPPSILYPKLYSYSSDGYFYETAQQNTVTAKVYAGQPLYFTTAVPPTEQLYVSADYTLTLSAGSLGPKDSLMKKTNLIPEDVSSFVCYTPGRYQINMNSVVDPSVAAYIDVIVEAAPNMENKLKGTYTQELIYPERNPVSVTFEQSGTDILAKVSFKGDTITLICKIEKDATLASYGITKYVLTTTIPAGTEWDTESQFSLSFNEAYDLVISHPDGYGTTETAVLDRTR